MFAPQPFINLFIWPSKQASALKIWKDSIKMPRLQKLGQLTKINNKLLKARTLRSQVDGLGYSYSQNTL
jgi:hypothetical protein